MAHRESCVGMAANMIGVRKRIIAFLDESGRVPTYTVMLNPEIIKKDGAYDTEEGCLSLLGGPRKCKRYKTNRGQNIIILYNLADRINNQAEESDFCSNVSVLSKSFAKETFFFLLICA